MALELLAAIITAVAFGGIAHLVRRFSGWRLPRWLVPAAAGLGMIGYTAWSEYSWFGRVSAELPPEVPVVWTQTGASALRPWTFLAPMTTRFVALDRREIAQHPANAALRLARIYSFARWKPTEDAMMVFDCAAGQQILLTDQITIDDQGILVGADWVAAGPEDGFQKAACQED
jgi:hypothetical protein